MKMTLEIKMNKPPKWLSPIAVEYYTTLLPEIKPHLTLGKGEVFAIFCQTLADYRAAIVDGDTRQRKVCLDFVLKFAKEFNLTLKGSVPVSADPLDVFVGS